VKVKSIYRVSESEQIDYISHIYREREGKREMVNQVSGIGSWTLDRGF